MISDYRSMAMQPAMDSTQTLQELRLIQCSLLQDEQITFPGGSLWENVLYNFSDDKISSTDSTELYPVSFSVRVYGAKVWFDITIDKPFLIASDVGASKSHSSISVKGEDVSRTEQERWTEIAKEKLESLTEAEYPLYETLSLYLLPLLHEAVESIGPNHSGPIEARQDRQQSPPYHVLFTSHHLISTTKRRLLQQWSSSLNLSGFAKLGHPGLIYAQGHQTDVEEFVSNVKGMQWLALKVRFVEPLQGPTSAPLQGWTEYQKVGKVVEEMRRIGREEYVIEMGIGSAGAN